MMKIRKTIAVFFGVLLLMGSALALSYNSDATVKIPRDPSTGEDKKIYPYPTFVGPLYTGLMSLEDIELKFQSTVNSRDGYLEFEAYGENEKGILILEQKKGSSNYEGYLKFIDGNGDTMYGEVKATLVRKGNQLSGNIVAKLESTNGESKKVKGTIILYEEKNYVAPVYSDKKEDYPNPLANWVKSDADAMAKKIDSDAVKKENVKEISDYKIDEKKSIWKKFFDLFSKDKEVDSKEEVSKEVVKVKADYSLKAQK